MTPSTIVVGSRVTQFGRVLVGVSDGRVVWCTIVVDANDDRATRDAVTHLVARTGARVERCDEHVDVRAALAWVDAWCASANAPVGVEVDLALAATPLMQTLLETVRTIPVGDTLTYGELAARAGAPGRARAAGMACARTPISLFVPVHRVVAAGGIGGYGRDARGVDIKRALLAHERRARLI